MRRICSVFNSYFAISFSMTWTKAWILALAVTTACSGGNQTSGGATAGPTRIPKNDRYCHDASLPHAYEYSDQTAAEKAGCSVVRVYRAVEDEKTGRTMDDEAWVFCCPRR
ncbi:MAG: hypothetical protein U1F66_11110 [bacterium]